MTIVQRLLLSFIAVTVVAYASPALAYDYLKSMIAWQQAGNATNNEVTLRVELDWDISTECQPDVPPNVNISTGETVNKTFTTSDIAADNGNENWESSSGVGAQACSTEEVRTWYGGDGTKSSFAFSVDPTYPCSPVACQDWMLRWERTAIVPWSNSPIQNGTGRVRHDFTYKYASSGVYTATVQVGARTITVRMVAGSGYQAKRILAIGRQSKIEGALALAGIDPCPAATEPPGLCYEFKIATTLDDVSFGNYSVVLVGSGVPSNALTLPEGDVVSVLNARKGELEDWLKSTPASDTRGMVVYGQTDAESWEWVPVNGGSLSIGNAGSAQDKVSVVDSGFLHVSHQGQVPTTPDRPGTLANWAPSSFNTFTTTPSYFDGFVFNGDNIGDKGLARITDNDGSPTGAKVNVADQYPPDKVTNFNANARSCQFLSGQPVDDRAEDGVLAAEQLFRTSLMYALSCREVLGQVCFNGVCPPLP